MPVVRAHGTYLLQDRIRHMYIERVSYREGRRCTCTVTIVQEEQQQVVAAVANKRIHEAADPIPKLGGRNGAGSHAKSELTGARSPADSSGGWGDHTTGRRDGSSGARDSNDEGGWDKSRSRSWDRDGGRGVMRRRGRSRSHSRSRSHEGSRSRKG